MLERNNNIYVDTQAQLGISSNFGLPGLRIRVSSNNGASFLDAIFASENGNVGINNTVPSERLHVIGGIRANALLISSDKRFKTNIRSMENGLSEITKLRGVRYEFSQSFLREKDGKSRSRMGFITQEVQEVFPELVYPDSEGYLAVDYISLIPLLVEAIKQQNNEMEAMKTQIEALESSDPKAERLEEGAIVTSGKAELYRNAPNPFNQASKIRYYLPDEANNAAIFIYNLNGKQVKRYDLKDKGHGFVEVSGSEFEAGMYIYALVVDGKELASKRMILTE